MEITKAQWTSLVRLSSVVSLLIAAVTVAAVPLTEVSADADAGGFSEAVVSGDGAPCPQVAADMLAAGGSAADAAIAALLCNGVVKSESMGIGGGFLLTYYNASSRKVFSLDAREKAPLAATQDMFHGNSQLSFVGPLAVAVPGEVRGYRALYEQLGGSMPWGDLFEPAIQLCEEGYPVSSHMANSLEQKREYILQEPSMSMFVDNITGDVYKEGDVLYRPDLAQTLRVLQQEPDALYTGSLVENFVGDLADMGGIITTQDMEAYQVVWGDPIEAAVHDPAAENLTLYTAPLPGSGVLLAFMMNVLDGYDFDETSDDTQNTVLTHQRVTETFKYAYAARTRLGDPQFVDVEDLVFNLTSKEFAAGIRDQILETSTSQDPAYYGGRTVSPSDHGTAHVSIIAPSGDALSVTSTINSYFGAVVASTSTGVVYNNEMDDFSSPNITNDFGVPPSEENFIVPEKRPLSSMVPSILVDGTGMVRQVVGAAGGTKITTSVALTIFRNLWFGSTIDEAVVQSRIHHQLYPMVLEYEQGFDEEAEAGLEEIGHVTEETEVGGAVVSGVTREGGSLYGAADPRSSSQVAGF